MSKYKLKTSHPKQKPSATIYLGGLLCLCFDDVNNCTVGVNKVDKHKWKLRLREWGATSDLRTWHQSTHSTYEQISIVVTDGTTSPTGTNGVYVYKGPDTGTLPGTTEERFDLESNWVDLEGDRGHGTSIKNDSKTLYPRLSIPDGLFCAYRLSKGLFNLENTKPSPELVKTLNKVALAVAADIYLNRTDAAGIKIILPDETYTLDKTKNYQIYFTNNCEDSTCDPNKIDFNLHYKAFSDAFSGAMGKLPKTDKCNLVYQQMSEEGDPDPIFFADKDLHPLTDRAPCMTVTLGQTSNFKA